MRRPAMRGHHRRSYITFAFCERETSSERRSDHLLDGHTKAAKPREGRGEERQADEANFSPLVLSSPCRTQVCLGSE